MHYQRGYMIHIIVVDPGSGTSKSLNVQSAMLYIVGKVQRLADAGVDFDLLAANTLTLFLMMFNTDRRFHSSVFWEPPAMKLKPLG